MIAVCGECLIDFIPQTTKSLSPPKNSNQVIFPSYRALIGGSPLNTAVALSRLNNSVTLVGRLSQDAFGKAILKHLKLNRVGDKTLAFGKESSTIGFVIPREKGNEDFVFYADSSADKLFHIRDVSPLPNTIEHFHFSSIALQMEPCGTAYEHLMKREYRHRTISLDPNIRPLFIKNWENFRKRMERMISMVGVFRASDQDLKYLYPQQSPEVTMKNILPRLRPPQISVLTLGSKGAVLYYLHGNQIKKLQRPIVKKRVVDTVGAGDSFTGAFLHILYRHGLIGYNKSKQHLFLNTLQEALDFATRAAAVNCSREGCNPAFLNEVRYITKIKKAKKT